MYADDTHLALSSNDVDHLSRGKYERCSKTVKLVNG